jgi:magnesium chelatase subunit I
MARPKENPVPREAPTAGPPDGGARGFPFTAIVGQEELKVGLLLNAVEPRVGGILILGHRGTSKSTAVRALAPLLPKVPVIEGCPARCAPDKPLGLCRLCEGAGGRLPGGLAPPGVVTLPLGATEEAVAGTLDVAAALREGRKRFEFGILARAHRGILYIDEVNLLEDHLVDVLLDVAASGTNIVERDGVSVEHPSSFILVGSGNPEEGELRPQLLDRFGLMARVKTLTDSEARVEIVRRRMEFDESPEAFAARWSRTEAALEDRLVQARDRQDAVVLPGRSLERIALVAAGLLLDGHRGEIAWARAATALAALVGEGNVNDEHLMATAHLALRHRLRQDPLSDILPDRRIDEALDTVFGPSQARAEAETALFKRALASSEPDPSR